MPQVLHPIEGPRLKVGRAKAHIEEIRTAQAAFLDRGLGYRVVVAERKSHSQYHLLRAVEGVPPPPEIGLFVGDAVHQLRSALDGLVFQLVLLNPTASLRARATAQMPIFAIGRPKTCTNGINGSRKVCRGRSSHWTCRPPGWIGGLIPKHQAMIERLQPYHRQNGGENDPLFLLHELNLADKHRLLPVAGAITAYYEAGSWQDDGKPEPIYRIRRRSLLIDGSEVGITHARDVLHGRVEMDQPIAPILAFWQGCEAVCGMDVVWTLEQMADRVEAIIESFSGEFPS